MTIAKYLVGLAVSAGAMAASATASAAVFDFSYAGAGIAASGQIFTTDTTTTVSGRQAYTITGITGTRNGSAIDQLFPSGTLLDNQGSTTLLYLFAAAPNLGFEGFGYGVAGDNNIYNPYNLDGQYIEYTGYNIGNNPLTSFSVTQQAAGVPEPATWAMMLLGFAVVGAAMRRRVTRVAYA